ncbi:hypothetical protein VNO78_00791 [Psophocarpus tetragonolobus]|uniref:Uncharacterized protein n=1 Tax=Psophocarpus tetragonolobus TaxID=3891 RepID=A0AAN9SXR2_PSOTE
MRSITTSIAPSPSQHSTWHSPVPYLFGGLAAMLGLIAFALFILACSYWKLSAHPNTPQRDLDTQTHKHTHSSNNHSFKLHHEQKILVIMAGDHTPSFLATPKASSFTPPPPNHFHKHLQNQLASHNSDKQTETHLQQPQ